MLGQYAKSLFRNLFSPAAHPNLSKTHDVTPKNVASRKRGYETIHGHKYVSTYKYLHYMSAGIWKQNITHVKNRKLSMMNLCLCVSLLRILITKHSSNYNVRIYNFL
jgi:hypothetical protein